MICTKCKKDKSADEFRKNRNFTLREGLSYQCKECDSVEKQSIEGHVGTMYHAAVFNSRKRKHGPPNFTRNELLEWCLKDSKFKAVYDNWVASDYGDRLAPSLDRLDTRKGYRFDNIEIISWKDNHERNVKVMSTRVVKLDEDGKTLDTYNSIREAARDCSKNSTGNGIRDAIDNPEKKAYGHHWALEEEVPALEGRKLKHIRLNKVFQNPEPSDREGRPISDRLTSFEALALTKKTKLSVLISTSELNSLILNHKKRRFGDYLLENQKLWAGVHKYMADIIEVKAPLEHVLKQVLRRTREAEFDSIKVLLKDIKLPEFNSGHEYLTQPVYGNSSIRVLTSKNALEVKKGGSMLSIREVTNVSKKKSGRARSEVEKVVENIPVMGVSTFRASIKSLKRMQLHDVKRVKSKSAIIKLNQFAEEAVKHMLKITRKVNGRGAFTQCYHALNGLYEMTQLLLTDEPASLSRGRADMIEYLEAHLSKYE